MRVVVVLPGIAAAPTGGYAVAYRYVNALAAAGHEVTVLHARTRKPGDHPDLGLRRVAYAARRHAGPTWFRLHAAVRVHNTARLVPDAIPAAGVLIATGVRTAPAVAEAVARTGARGIYLVQHVETFVATEEEVVASWRLPLEKVVVSGWLHDVLAGAGVPSVLVPNGVDRHVFRPGRHPEVPGVLAMVSTQRWKRTDLVCEVYRAVAASEPGVRLTTFGTGVRPDGLPASAVHVRNPQRADLADLYRASSLYVCASDDEGFGLPVAEAMSCGAAVVSTDIAGVRSFALDAPRYAPAGDGPGLTAAVLGLLADPIALSSARARSREVATGLDAAESARRFVALVDRSARVAG
ncbi:glycosyltransferase family 4 protein [Cellulomonas sp. C5510]|uniref:glycosyltransferase family 4 protein n=1 Tax=Cellulomonas sp. C5510 TaxID=2871170 RepID=UPI001C98A89E|nr:glycosyltransferase family 4 protein [Cellulomonas sp. C5510]QZN84860.1 glycosyltransferase family 4 protein [Cellulomonas sp. C5510]